MREMKDSGVEWIGEIPKDWEISSFKRVFSFDKGLPITKENLVESGIPVLSYGQIHSKSNSGIRLSDDLLRHVSEDYLTTNPSSLAEQGDILFADTSEDYEGIGNCAYINTDIPIFAGYHTIITRPKDIGNPQYLAFLFQTDNWRSQLRGSASGIKVFTISQSMLKEATVIIPPSQTQHRIADYLDVKCAQIDRAIARQQEVIEKLKEYKLSVITEAVTKGLNPDAPMKDSGIEWIGEIPEHWTMLKLRYVGTCQNGISKDGESFGSGYPFISYSDVYKNFVVPEKASALVESSDEERTRFSVCRGDVFFTRTSETIEEIGLTAICLRTIDEATFAGFLIRVRPFENTLHPEFSKYYFRSEKHRRFFVKEMNLITRASLGQELLKRLPVLLPPMEEQQEIAEYLDEKWLMIESVASGRQQVIDKLTEYKKSLVHEVVTGKREV